MQLLIIRKHYCLIIQDCSRSVGQGLSDFIKTAPLTASNNDPQTILRVLSGLVALKTAVGNYTPFNVVEDIMASPIDRDMEKASQTS